MLLRAETEKCLEHPKSISQREQADRNATIKSQQTQKPLEEETQKTHTHDHGGDT